MLESESKALLALYGLPVTREHRVSSPEQAAAACSDLGSNRVALKILSPDLSHKSDVGGVALHLDSASAVHAAAEKMLCMVTAAAQLVGGHLASHSRGINHSQLEAVAEAMVTLGRIAIELPEIDQIDINPLVVALSGQQVVDVLVIVRAPR